MPRQAGSCRSCRTLAPMNLRRVALLLSLLTALVSAAMASHIALHVHITMWPSEWEEQKIEQAVPPSGSNQQVDVERILESVQRIRGNERQAGALLVSIKSVSLAYAVAVLVLALLTSIAVFRAQRTSSAAKARGS